MCNNCGKGFPTSKDRTRHQHIHDVDPYYCNSCNYVNARQDHLTEHKRKNHAKSLAEVRTERRQAAIKPVSRSVECKTEFPYKYLLSSSSPKDDCVLVESCDIGSTRYTHTDCVSA